MAIQVVPSTKPLGAEIRGVDLAHEPSDEAIGAVRDALNKYGVVCIRDQRLSPPQQMAFTRHLGPLQAHSEGAAYRLHEYPDVVVISNILQNGQPIGVVDAGQSWHSDISYSPLPPAYACLHALEVPQDESGEPLGDTRFASNAWAYETLEPEIRKRLETLRAYHSREIRPVSVVRDAQITEFDRVRCFEQPVVRVHPVTGRKSLYVNPTYTERLIGLDDKESKALLKFLFEHIVRDEVIYRHRGRAGDLLIWDDCAVLHHATADYALPQRRLIYRTTVEGTQPFGVADRPGNTG